ncbi:MAG: glycosyltransferase family 2 protein [Bacteroidetes bacterium]|nr:MAG: glycosyltransferase family 2 protein [Bacteroidota bacterium]
MNGTDNKKCDISLIILNYNSSDYTLSCIKSIFDTSSNDNYEIIIVDNNSRLDEFEKISSLDYNNNVKIVRSRINLGFSGGNMYGFQFANKNSRYILFLNNDCLFINDVITILYNFMEGNRDACMCTAQMFSPEMEFRPSFTYLPKLSVKIFGHLAVRFFSPSKYPLRRKEYDTPVDVPVITGSAMFVRVKHFIEIGGFDTNYFLYSEEEDLGMRFSLKGYKIYLVPSAKFVHINGGSTDYNINVLKEFYISLFYFYRKFYGFPRLFLLKVYFAIKNLRKFYKSWDFFKIGIFVIKGAPMKDSLRFKQKISLD